MQNLYVQNTPVMLRQGKYDRVQHFLGSCLTAVCGRKLLDCRLATQPSIH